MPNDDVQTNLLLLQEYQERMDAIFQQIRLINELIAEYKSAQNTLEELASTQQGEELLVPLGGNVFVRASITNTKTVLTGIGDGAVMEKSINNANNFLEKRIRELQGQEEQLIQVSQDIRSKVEQLNQKLQPQQGTD